MFVKFRFVILILFLLPLLISSSNVRKRRRQGVEQQTEDLSNQKVPDQLALATRNLRSDYRSQQGYSENKNRESVSHQNFAINLIKPNEQQTSDFFDQTLADVETAQEYVAKALELHAGRDVSSSSSSSINPLNPEINTITRSTSPKYEVYEGEDSRTEAPSVQMFEKDSVTRSSYDDYDINDNDYTKVHPNSFISFSTEHYEPENIKATTYDYHQREMQLQQSDNVKEATNKIPKEEILRHIEESVMKYMKTLEAEGKLPIQEPKIYYKIQHHQTPEPDKLFKEAKQQKVFSSSPSESHRVVHHPKSQTGMKILYKEPIFHQDEPPVQDETDGFNQNIEFIYKMKTRPPSPSQKYKNQPSSSGFDHSSALKQMQGFELSHAIQETRQTKPKLYFNTETYHDINSLPYKPEKVIPRQEQHNKEPESRRPPVDYKTYNQQQQDDSFNHYSPLSDHQSNQGIDDGYPIMNPYRYVLKKEPIPQKLLSAESGLSAQPSSWQPYSPSSKDIIKSSDSLSSSLQYDNYSPKYNNNPESSYGYQHNNYNKQSESSHSPKMPIRSAKRGKRGGGHSKKLGRTYSTVKDSEGNVILRPPPRKN